MAKVFLTKFKNISLKKFKWVSTVFIFIKKYWNLNLKHLYEACEESSMHGINHLIARNRHYLETVFWVLIVLYSWISLATITMNIFQRYQTSPTVISMERDNLSWNITFPSATLCFREVNQTALEIVVNEFKVDDKEALKEFLTKLSKLSMDEVTDDELEDHPAVPPERYMELVNRIVVTFLPQILSTITEPITIQRTMVEMGLCYAINSKVALYYSPEYWLQNNWTYIEQDDINTHVLDGERFIQLSDFNTGYKMYLHSSMEIPQATDRSVIGTSSTLRTIRLHSLNTYSTDGVRDLSTKQRKCRYLEERVLTRSPAYSYNMCIVECRARKTLEVCGCLPHFYRPLPNERICPASELRCLYVYRSSLLTAARDSDCHCLSTCESAFFTIYDDTELQWERSTQIKYGIDDYPKFRLKREVLFGLTDVLVNCGGAAGLLLGCSVLTIIEIFYFSTLRLFWFCIKHHRI